MRCRVCDEHGDLLRARIKKTQKEVIVCSECDSLWEANIEELDSSSFSDVSNLLENCGLSPAWDELDILEKLPAR